MTRLYWHALLAQWRGCLVLLSCSVLEALPALSGGKLIALAVDRGFGAGQIRAGLGFLALFGVASVLGALGSRLVWHWLASVVEPLRDVLVTAVVRGVLHNDHPPRNCPDASGVARITQHVEVVRDATGGLLVQARTLVVTTAAALVGVFTVARPLGWVATLPVAATVVVFALLLPSLARRQRAVTLADERTAAQAGTTLAGIRDVVACGAEHIAERAVHTTVHQQADTAINLARASVLRIAVVGIGGFIPLVLALALAPGLVASGQLSAGAALGALVYLATTMQPALQGLSGTASSVVLRMLVALHRLDETSRIPTPRTGQGQPTEVSLSTRGLSFGWGASAAPIVRELDLHLARGEVLAVVGPSGIGKSTLAGLLTGMLPPSSGQVLLGGVPIRDVSPRTLHALVALIPQESYVFAGTVRENLTLLAAATLDDTTIHDRCRAVGSHDLITRLGGLDAPVSRSTLSAGESQLLALTRVYLSSAALVVLDEATSHLDPAAEATAETAFAARGDIVVIVAHRLSSARRADRVLVLDGDETLLGEHTELLGRSTRYARLMSAWTDGDDALSLTL